MIICPNCQHYEIPGTLFCSECGSQLFSREPYDNQSPGAQIGRGTNRQVRFDTRSLGLVDLNDSPQPCLKIRLVDCNELIDLDGRENFTLGRVVDDQAVVPDVDLTPFQAHKMGVSRIHAALKLTPKGLRVVDMNSANGTRVNGLKIASNVEYPANLGDIISLGKLQIQVISFQTPKEVDRYANPVDSPAQ